MTKPLTREQMLDLAVRDVISRRATTAAPRLLRALARPGFLAGAPNIVRDIRWTFHIIQANLSQQVD